MKRVALICYLVLVHAALAYLIFERYRLSFFGSPPVASVSDPTAKEEVPTPLPVPSELSDLSNNNTETQAAANSENQSASNTENQIPPLAAPQQPNTSPSLIVPVAGVSRDKLIDTFTAARSEGRTHDAIDIPAAGGTPVLAVADGQIVKFWDSQRGGITIYEISTDKKYFYYYAHLQRRADGIKEGDSVRQGTVIGYVGDTGNAGPGNYHLHFGISIVTDPKHYWGGTDINPYPILRGNGGN